MASSDANFFQLQTSKFQLDTNVFPPYCAGEPFPFPQPSTQTSLGYSCRPNTMLYGTAPYMAGNGAPANLIDLESRMRPQSTKRFGKVLVPYTRGLFPLQKLPDCLVPLRAWTHDAASTRAELQNGLYQQRYCRK